MTSGTCGGRGRTSIGASHPRTEENPVSAQSLATAVPTRHRARPVGRFVRHYLEMVVAMLVGMLALGPLWSLAAPGLAGHPAAEVGVMVLDMVVGMGL